MPSLDLEIVNRQQLHTNVCSEANVFPWSQFTLKPYVCIFENFSFVAWDGSRPCRVFGKMHFSFLSLPSFMQHCIHVCRVCCSSCSSNRQRWGHCHCMDTLASIVSPISLWISPFLRDLRLMSSASVCSALFHNAPECFENRLVI